MSCKHLVQEICRKQKGSFFGLINGGVPGGGLRPLTGLKLKVYCPSEIASGSGTLYDTSSTLDFHFERAHRFCVKLPARLPSWTRTDIARPLIVVLPIMHIPHQYQKDESLWEESELPQHMHR